jgi:hypothetical protein
MNTLHGLLALRANERFVGFAYENLLLWIAWTCCHTRPLLACVKAKSVCFAMVGGLFFTPWRSDAVFRAIGHPDVHVQQGADVIALLVGEPVLITGGGDGAIATEADRVAASIAVVAMLKAGMMPMLEVGTVSREELQRCGGHMLAYFQTPERPDAISILRFSGLQLLFGE